jgi:hypothetical protein
MTIEYQCPACGSFVPLSVIEARVIPSPLCDECLSKAVVTRTGLSITGPWTPPATRWPEGAEL